LVHGENWNGQRPDILRHSLTRMFVEHVRAQELRWSPGQGVGKVLADVI
jgi:hypothetical protein